MLQRDYLMRLIAQMTESLGQIMQLRKENKQYEAIELLEELLEKQFGMSLTLIKSLSDEDIMKLVSHNGTINSQQMELLIHCLKQEGHIRNDLGHEMDMFLSFVKALNLLLRIDLLEIESAGMNRTKEIEQLLDILSPYELPFFAKKALVHWYYKNGEYALAENLLYELYDDELIPLKDLLQGYDELLKVPDEQLHDAGLTRDELLETKERLLQLEGNDSSNAKDRN